MPNSFIFDSFRPFSFPRFMFSPTMFTDYDINIKAATSRLWQYYESYYLDFRGFFFRMNVFFAHYVMFGNRQDMHNRDLHYDRLKCDMIKQLIAIICNFGNLKQLRFDGTQHICNGTHIIYVIWKTIYRLYILLWLTYRWIALLWCSGF